MPVQNWRLGTQLTGTGAYLISIDGRQRLLNWRADEEKKTLIYMIKKIVQRVMINKAIESMAIKSLFCILSASVRSVIYRLFCIALPIKPMRTIVKKKAKVTANRANVAAIRLFRINTKK